MNNGNYFYYGMSFMTEDEKKNFQEKFYNAGHEAVMKMAQCLKENGYEVDSKDWL